MKYIKTFENADSSIKLYFICTTQSDKDIFLVYVTQHSDDESTEANIILSEYNGDIQSVNSIPYRYKTKYFKSIILFQSDDYSEILGHLKLLSDAKKYNL